MQHDRLKARGFHGPVPKCAAPRLKQDRKTTSPPHQKPRKTTWRLLLEEIRSPRNRTTTTPIASFAFQRRSPVRRKLKDGTKTRTFEHVSTHIVSRRIIRHRPNCVPVTLRSLLRRRARWQCGDGDAENLVVSAFGSSPGDAAVKSGSAVRALCGERKQGATLSGCCWPLHRFKLAVR